MTTDWNVSLPGSENALTVEFSLLGIAFEQQRRFDIHSRFRTFPRT